MKVWVNGCFDVLHYGHFKLLNLAATLGDCLVIGIDSDLRIQSNKGVDRPYHNEEYRKYNLLSIKNVSKVIIFNTDSELKWNIQNEKPDIMLIGSDYKGKNIIGSEYIPKIVYFDRLHNFSTTDIIDDKFNS